MGKELEDGAFWVGSKICYAVNMKTVKQKAYPSARAQLNIPPGKIPESWKRAIGILKGKRIDGVAYQRKIRAEWEKRWKKQVRLARSRR